MAFDEISKIAFDEAMAMVGTYLTNNDLSNSYNNDRFFYIVLNGLRNKYAPTIEMTEGQRRALLEAKKDDSLYEIMGTGDGYYFDSLYWGDLKPYEIAQAYSHPETIKIVDE